MEIPGTDQAVQTQYLLFRQVNNMGRWVTSLSGPSNWTGTNRAIY